MADFISTSQRETEWNNFFIAATEMDFLRKSSFRQGEIPKRDRKKMRL